jgi:proteasome accessory factor C
MVETRGMAERETASGQLSRILHLLALAARKDGASVDELSGALDASPEQVLRDLQEVYTRAYYHPAGSGEDAQILIEADRVHVWTKGEFRRPARLTPGEALALGLGLRVLAAEADGERRARTLALAERLEEQLAGRTPEEHLAGIAVQPRRQGEAAIREAVVQSLRDRRRCGIGYLKPGAPEPDLREVEPYVVMASGGAWYVLARCCRDDAVKAFRLDRIIEVVPGAAGFEVPPDFDPHGHLSGGHVFRAEDDVSVTVRYSSKIARWIVERGDAEAQADGSVTVEHRVADPRWIVRHVLRYGPDAELVAPPEYRKLVADAAARLVGERAAATNAR